MVLRMVLRMELRVVYGADCINDAPTDTTNAVLIKFVDNPYGGVTGMT